ncbi:hypothetical protein QBC46DRAFT_395605 [Diplogelasinospora grovesii]|uniref:Immunoglobulin variable region used by the itc63b heavy chain n=1 Tax=Diplogelasinospora grovesii TaxID=303347 RepID=A0AAN6MZY0_9PEZI|nr:hypothetical protein QBC46DRAFT_395605 [Diplogelasinospora grovesii]
MGAIKIPLIKDSTMLPMKDAVCPTDEVLQAVFGESFYAWSGLYHKATKAADRQEVAFSCLAKLNDPALFPDHPAFPRRLTLEDKFGVPSATGVSTWEAHEGFHGASSPCTLAPFYRHFHMRVSQHKPMGIVFTNNPLKHSNVFPHWFSGDNNHITILMLAWAYILSARWAEVVEGAQVRYTEQIARVAADLANGKPAGSADSDISIHIGGTDVSTQAARWWAAVLAPGPGGWVAALKSQHPQNSQHSPWSIRLPLKSLFTISYDYRKRLYPLTEAASFADASRYLADYCAFHGLRPQQSLAALSAVLCFPAVNWEDQRLFLPLPRAHFNGSHGNSSAKAALQYPDHGCQQLPQQYSPPTANLDKFLVLSCNARGVCSLLRSTFFEPSIPCNLVSPYLQGTFAVLDRAAKEDRHLLASILITRKPDLGFLWIGAMMIGFDKFVLRSARFGSGWETELHSAVWTGTCATFIQQPVSPSPLTSCSPLDSDPDGEGRCQRADEGRLLFLASEDHQRYLPMSPWKPFGSTSLRDLDIEVRLHLACPGGHGLRYRGCTWDRCDDDEGLHNVEGSTSSPTRDTEETTSNKLRADGTIVDDVGFAVPYDEFDAEDDSASRHATLDAFRWVRMNGFPAAEQTIRRHEWICDVLDEENEPSEWTSGDEDEIRDRTKSNTSNRPRKKMSEWLAGCHAGVMRGGSVGPA